MNQFNIKKIVLLLSIILTLFSCKKEAEFLGLDLIPEGDLLNHELIDTLTISAYTVKDMEINTDELSTHLLGIVNDPVFGKTSASLYTQLRMPSTSLNFGTGAVADSLVLKFAVRDYYGDIESVYNIQVQELAGDIVLSNTYNQHSTVAAKPEIIGQATGQLVELTDTTSKVIGYEPIKIMLSNTLAERIISAPASALASHEEFLKLFKGIVLKPGDSTITDAGIMLYLNLLSENSRITLYYHNSTKPKDSVVFRINDLTARFNNYNHFGYNGADPLLLQQFNGDTTAGGEKLFLQAMGGARIKIDFPFLNKLSDKKIAIHEAVLKMENADPDALYPMPALIGIRKYSKINDSTYRYTTIPDEESGLNYIDGSAKDNKTYQLRITRYIQQRINNPDSPVDPLYIVTGGASISSNRVVLKGPKVGNGAMKLYIYYTSTR